MIDWVWIGGHLGDIAGRTVQHLYLAALALALGFAISLVLAVAAARRPRVRGPVTVVAGTLYTIPSLALFAALVPITGLTVQTAVIPLVLYTLIILVRNTVVGLESVPPDVLEAADAMGYSASRRLWRVELPLALPLVVAGLRLAAVSTIALVAVSGILGDRFGGLGFFMFEGYRRGFPTEIFAGALPAILLALAVDLLLAHLQARLTPWERAAAGGSAGPGPGEAPRPRSTAGRSGSPAGGGA